MDFATEDASLNGGTNCHYFVWIDTFVGLFAKEVSDSFLDGWHTSLTTNEDDFVDLTGFDFGVSQTFLNWLD